jgi:hypothetical protein
VNHRSTGHGQPDHVGVDGRRWCRVRHPVKVCYATRDEAIFAATRTFAERGWILTPYLCLPAEREFVDVGPIRPNAPGKVRLPIQIVLRVITVPGCGRWHLTRTPKVLNP